MSKQIFVSDIHMASPAAVMPRPGKYPYGWLSPAEADRLGGFLRSSEVTECDELFVVGDALDVWTCPHDTAPPTPSEIINAPHNKPIIDGIRAFAAKPGKKVFYIRGNHDDQVNAGHAREIAPNIIFGSRYDHPPLRVRHGHEDALFNAPDPTGRPFPLGYFITRFTATAAERGIPAMSTSFRTILKSGPEVVKLLKNKPLAECVFDTVLQETGVKIDDKVIMPDGSTVLVGNVRETYQNLVAEWNEHRPTDAFTAVLCEWDPYYALPVGTRHVNVVGHSHDRKFAWADAYGMYLNLGAWCGEKAHFGKTWLEDAGSSRECMWGQVCRWDPETGVQSCSPKAGIPTK